MNILKSVCTASIASALLLRMLGHALPSPAQGFSDAAVFLVLSVLTKVLLRTNFEARRPRTQLLVAQASAGTSDASWHLNRKEVSRHRISGAIQLQDMDSYLSAPVLTTEELLREIRLDRADGVLICAPSTAIFALSERLESWDGLNTPIRFIVGSAQGLSSRSHIAGADCLYLFNTGAEPAGTLNYRLLKRAFDIVFSLIAIAGCLPLMLLVALAVKMGSSGPALFSQDRVGWNGRVFRMYKFRTMHIAPEAESDVRWTPPDDPHRTPIGRFLRKYSLDELPQFFNVLKGDMSVVGPRPERPFFVNSFRKQIDEYHRRHQLKVGITGWAQVHGLRGDTCIRTRLMYDLYYLQHWGLIFDLKIILRTVLCIFKANNAY